MGLNKIRKDIRAVSPVIAIILMVAITVVLASVLYVWVTSFLPDGTENDFKFPTLEITLTDGMDDGDTLDIKHTSGDPLDWKKYKVIITNNTDKSDTAVITDLSSLGQITAGEYSTITESGISGFSDIDYVKGNSYQLEIYNLKENKRVMNKQNVICI
jgi:flagellin-like protein